MLNELKSEIKRIEAEQKSLKPQRKTIHFTGNRVVPADQAAHEVKVNKGALRHLYIVYGQLRGKTLEQVEPHRKSEPNPWIISKLLEKYKPVEILV